MRTPEQTAEIVARLEEAYPLADCTLDWGKDYELLFSVRLAAQCTDERVNMITPALFERYPTLKDFAEADVAEVEKYIRSCGFFHTKARDIVACAQVLLAKHGGKVPDNMDDLLALPGVGRKTANLILGDVFHAPGAVVGHALHSPLKPHGLCGHQGPPEDRGRAPRRAAAGEELRLLPPPRPARPGGVHCPRTEVRGLLRGARLPLCDGRVSLSPRPRRRREIRSPA